MVNFHSVENSRTNSFPYFGKQAHQTFSKTVKSTVVIPFREREIERIKVFYFLSYNGIRTKETETADKKNRKNKLLFQNKDQTKEEMK